VKKGTEAEVGWFEVALTEEGRGDPLFVGVEQRFYVFQYHIDQVTRLPEGGVNLARSPLCPIQAFRYGDKPAWGLQFHLEVQPPQAEEILRGGGRLPVEDVEGMVARGYQVYGPAQAKIFENFFLQVRRSLVCVG
jgi:GMP synthase-like glutamine amidotransferase